ncbi:ATP-binding cassette domain-containing protein [Parabacteroides sp. FAFU027]|uniref:ABC transporter ATP-binding protein n=1 Tax=Parabacteroides sp. FAFU027 TaxID=2922715 RepID=UPI001FB01EF4|nr:ABC transporter ATP-binding protein [Parabacteroides sp. FAFU027]
MIQLKDLQFAYSRKKPLFETINLELKAGNIYGLLGKNGVGKTTLLNLMCGLLFPKSGECIVMGLTPAKREVAFLRNLFYVPDEIALPSMKMKDFVRVNKVFYPNFDEDLLKNCLDEFELDENENLAKLSHGQKKKAFISFALACQTQLLLMDEPTNGLDIPSKSTFRKLMASVATEERCIVISTHQVRDLENLIDAVVIMNNRRVLLNGTLDQITEKLTFRELVKDEKALYEESGLKGRWGVVENTTGEYSKVDMEMLFNAVEGNKKEIERIFAEKQEV